MFLRSLGPMGATWDAQLRLLGHTRATFVTNAEPNEALKGAMRIQSQFSVDPPAGLKTKQFHFQTYLTL